MGFIAPLVITGRILARNICSTDTAWDDDLPDTYRPDWDSWRHSLHSLSHFSIPRMFMLDSLSKGDKPEIHVYSDASEKAIAAVDFVKLENMALSWARQSLHLYWDIQYRVWNYAPQSSLLK